MYKQSAYVIALFLGTSQAFVNTPESHSLFATGMNGDEDLNEDITMKGKKFHFNQQSTNGEESNVQIESNDLHAYKGSSDRFRMGQVDPKF